MDVATEIERKYDTSTTFALPDLTGPAGIARVGAPLTHELDATYFDTVDLRLAHARVTLRRRTGGADAGWHLKTPGDGDGRTEHQVPLGDADTVPDELLDQVRAIVRGLPLLPVARLRTRRREYPLRDAAERVLALLADDKVRADTDEGTRRWREVEVELVDGDDKVLKAVDKRLCKAGATHADGPSKLARALGDRLRDAAPADDGHHHPAPVQAVRDYLREQRDAIVTQDPAVRRGDAEAVHAMRVATRRLRSSLRTFRGKLWHRDRTDALRAELSWLADRLGGVRDRQVMAARLQAVVAAQPPALIVGPVADRIAAHLDGDLQAGRRELGQALDDVRYFTLLDQLDALLVTPPDARVHGDWVRRRARKVLHHADDLLAAAQDPTDPDPATDRDPAAAAEAARLRNERFHDARKAFKQARYAVEVFAPHEGAPARKLVKRLTAMQDELGDHQDAVITAALLRDYAERAHAAGDNAFSYGVLYAHQVAAGEAALTRVPEARSAAADPDLRGWLE